MLGMPSEILSIDTLMPSAGHHIANFCEIAKLVNILILEIHFTAAKRKIVLRLFLKEPGSLSHVNFRLTIRVASNRIYVPVSTPLS